MPAKSGCLLFSFCPPPSPPPLLRKTTTEGPRGGPEAEAVTADCVLLLQEILRTAPAEGRGEDRRVVSAALGEAAVPQADGVWASMSASCCQSPWRALGVGPGPPPSLT